MIRHAGLVARRLGGRWLGALIEGEAGAGKSDLALRALGEGFRLVADDRVILWTSGGRLFGRAPDTLFGHIEARGLDVVDEAALPFCEIGLIARCGAPDRIPERQACALLGVRVPALTLAPLEASAAAKLSRALAMFDHDPNRRM